MALVTYDFLCTNTACESSTQRQELLVHRSEVDSQICKDCGAPLTRVWTPTVFPTHISWSKWRAL